jgi:hypothetical protein
LIALSAASEPRAIILSAAKDLSVVGSRPSAKPPLISHRGPAEMPGRLLPLPENFVRRVTLTRISLDGEARVSELKSLIRHTFQQLPAMEPYVQTI